MTSPLHHDLLRLLFKASDVINVLNYNLTSQKITMTTTKNNSNRIIATVVVDTAGLFKWKYFLMRSHIFSQDLGI